LATVEANPPGRQEPVASIEPPATTAAQTAQGLNPYRWVILIGLVMASLLELLDTTSVNVALRQMAGNFGATYDEIAWVSTGYILSNVIVLPLTAWLSSLFGRKKYLVGSIILFTIASVFCGASHTLGELVLWRIVQGAGGAALLSTAQATLREVFPREQQGMIQAVFTVTVVVGPTLGPTFGGWVTDNYSWPWIFYLKSPLGILAAWMVGKFLHDSEFKHKPGPVDWQGITLLALGLGSLQYVLEEGERYDWFDNAWITRLTIFSVVMMIAFVIRELCAECSPVVNLRVLKNTELTAGAIMLFVGGLAIYGGTFLLPLYVQGVLGFTATETGLLFFPAGFVTIVFTMISGKLLNGANPLVKPSVLVAIGIIIFAFSQWELGSLTAQSGSGDIMLALIVRGVSFGFFFTTVTVASLSSLKGPEIAQGAAMTNLSRQLGGSLGIALMNTFVTDQTIAHRTDLVQATYQGSQTLIARQGAIAHGLVAHGYGAVQAREGALGIINSIIQVQATTLAYDDAFKVVAVGLMICLPGILLFHVPKRRRA
jgi:DHA2 family multidrug resistance protein